ncbi:hypothetical protein E9228_002790 [Curtobacterium flaccumfaciens]|uniref:Uncharacterized protein n=1 Tax=Curtobacterium salicis TaxID=1779862 RepID=A0ABX0TAP7_9MICO|nr:hypothetical protein [Curtobacterium sp. WW7]NII42132.1 hypothetical protein [Curtobacterium sp. WW7]
MNKTEVSKLLTVASAIDHRTIDPAIVNAWHMVVGDVPFDAAERALTAHRRNRPGVYLEPGHIIEQWRIERAKERELRGPHPAPPLGQRWAVDCIEQDYELGAGPSAVTDVSL